jgi:hypothetical protein
MKGLAAFLRRRRYLTAAFVLFCAFSTFWVVMALADAGNPLVGTTKGELVQNPDGTATVYVRGEWNWLSHNKDCNFDRAATGVAMIWNDPTEDGYLLTKGSVSAEVGVKSKDGSWADPNQLDPMVHPVDRGNVPEGYTTPVPAPYTAKGFPAGQQFVDPATNDPATQYTNWKGGCGREPLTGADAGQFAGDPWGSWGFEKSSLGSDGNTHLGYKHTYRQRSDVTRICVNFYDVHGGGSATSTKFQLVNGAKEITVNGNGDNSIQTNAFNVNGGSCIFFPQISTTALGPVTIGGSITDTATITGANAGAGGTVTFRAFSDAGCTSQVFTSTNNVSASGANLVATSAPFTPQAAGSYYWTADYSGDASKGTEPVKSACGDAGEKSTISRAGPIIRTTASGPVTIGQAISDTAALAGGIGPTGTITFKVYAPKADGSADTACSTLVKTLTVSVNGNDTYSSGNFTPSGTAPEIAGTYEWTATYSGDANNAPAATSCGDTGESSVVNKKSTTTPTGQKIVISDFAKPTGFGTPTGTVTFKLFDTANCTGNPIFEATATLDANGLAHVTNPNALNANGTYKWVVTYNGDANNEASTSPCGTEQVTMSGNTPGVDP